MLEVKNLKNWGYWPVPNTFEYLDHEIFNGAVKIFTAIDRIDKFLSEKLKGK